MVSFARPSRSSAANGLPTCVSCSTIPSAYSSWPEIPRSSCFTWVRKCIRVPFHHTKTGLPAACCASMNAIAASEVSSSIVSMRFRVSGPVSPIFCVPSGWAHEWITPRGPNVFRNSGFFG